MWGVHVFTALGVVFAFLTVTSSVLGHPREALLWLMAAQIVDGVDGPIARKLETSRHVPVLSGLVLDLIVDFCTCVFAPVLFAWQFDLLPSGWETPLLALVLITSVLWFSRDDIETRDLWFRGFPTGWNLVFTLYWVVDLPDPVVIGVTLLLCVLTITPWYKVPHVMGAPQHRPVTVGLSVIGLIATVILIIDRDSPLRPACLAVMAVWVLWYFGVGLWRSLQGDEVLPDPEAAPSSAGSASPEALRRSDDD